jgi:hypothetical protein
MSACQKETRLAWIPGRPQHYLQLDDITVVDHLRHVVEGRGRLFWA